MRIETVEAEHFRVPLAVPLSDSTHGLMAAFELVTVRVRDAEGAEGLGYTYTVGAAGGAGRALLADDLAPLLVGEDADAIERLWQRMWWGVHYAGRGGPTSFAMSAVDIALWDLKAKRAGLPLWKLAGGHDPAVPVYAGGIDLYFTLDELLAQTDGNLAKGFRAIKMKVGRPSLAEDLERVRAMRAHLPSDVPLMVDANMRWSVDEAVRAARGLAPLGIHWLEEPTIPDDVDGHARIVREGGVPIAAGENLHTLYEFQRYLKAGAVTFPEPDCSNCGGPTVWLKVAHLAEAFNLPVTSHGIHDIHVHLLAAVPNCSYLEAHGFGLERFMAEPLKIADGVATAPDRPGHGVAFDWQALGRHRA